MKGNSFKIIFIILIVVIIAAAVYMNIPHKNNTEKAQEIQKFSDNAEKILSNDIRIGIIELDNMNPILSNNKNVQDISRLIFDPLFTLTQDYKLESALATEWTQLDNTTYLIKLRENVKWQDGSNFNSSDVIFTIDMLKKEDNHSAYSQNVANISEIQEIDEYTLKIKLNKEVPYFEYYLIFPIVSGSYFNEENFKQESKNIKPIGTGLFYISDVSNDRILLKRNVIGWNNQTFKLDTITICLYDSLSSAINAYKSGEIDLFTTSNTNIEEYLKNTNYSKQEYINRNYIYLSLNCNQKVLSNVEVRQAINSAIDKQKIIKEIYNGKFQVSNFPLDFGSYAYDSSNVSVTYNQNTAKKFLVDKKWKYSSKKWRKTVNYRYLTIELKLVVNKTSNNMVKVANKIKEQLESVGIRITVEEATQKQYNNYLKNKNYDMILMNGTYGYSPSLDKYLSQESNTANFKDEQIKELLSQAKNTTDENELKKIYTQIVEIYNNQVPYISLFYNTNTLIYSGNIKGNIHPNSYNLFYGIENWYREYKK